MNDSLQKGHVSERGSSINRTVRIHHEARPQNSIHHQARIGSSCNYDSDSDCEALPPPVPARRHKRVESLPATRAEDLTDSVACREHLQSRIQTLQRQVDELRAAHLKEVCRLRNELRLQQCEPNRPCDSVDYFVDIARPREKLCAPPDADVSGAAVQQEMKSLNELINQQKERISAYKSLAAARTMLFDRSMQLLREVLRRQGFDSVAAYLAVSPDAEKAMVGSAARGAGACSMADAALSVERDLSDGMAASSPDWSSVKNVCLDSVAEAITKGQPTLPNPAESPAADVHQASSERYWKMNSDPALKFFTKGLAPTTQFLKNEGWPLHAGEGLLSKLNVEPGAQHPGPSTGKQQETCTSCCCASILESPRCTEACIDSVSTGADKNTGGGHSKEAPGREFNLQITADVREDALEIAPGISTDADSADTASHSHLTDSDLGDVSSTHSKREGAARRCGAASKVASEATESVAVQRTAAILKALIWPAPAAAKPWLARWRRVRSMSPRLTPAKSSLLLANPTGNRRHQSLLACCGCPPPVIEHPETEVQKACRLPIAASSVVLSYAAAAAISADAASSKHGDLDDAARPPGEVCGARSRRRVRQRGRVDRATSPMREHLDDDCAQHAGQSTLPAISRARGRGKSRGRSHCRSNSSGQSRFYTARSKDEEDDEEEVYFLTPPRFPQFPAEDPLHDRSPPSPRGEIRLPSIPDRIPTNLVYMKQEHSFLGTKSSRRQQHRQR